MGSSYSCRFRIELEAMECIHCLLSRLNVLRNCFANRNRTYRPNGDQNDQQTSFHGAQ
jgi:hypothetical protein